MFVSKVAWPCWAHYKSALLGKTMNNANVKVNNSGVRTKELVGMRSTNTRATTTLTGNLLSCHFQI
jgi:hypothetical protein